MHSFKLFGPLTIEKDDKPVSLMGSPKACALIAYLIAHDRPQSREVVADLFWDALDTSRALGTLRSLVLRTRKAIPELAVSRKQLGFEVLPDTAVDLLQLESALASHDVSQIDQALTLYQGEFLADFYLPDAMRFNDWLLLERENWRQKIWGAYDLVCQSYISQEDWQAGSLTATRWLRNDPLDETVLRKLMQSLANQGQGERAWQQYELSRALLWDELGVEPAEETTRLAESARDQTQEIVVGLPTAEIANKPDMTQLAEPGALPRQSLLPYQRNGEFVGRSALLLDIAQQFFPEDDLLPNRATVVSGMGGLGKTQFAVEFCYRYGRYFSGGVFWLSFADPDSVADEVAQIGGERGMGLYREGDRLTQVDKVGRVRQAWQDDQPRLLVFDNCEDEALLTEWLPVTGQTRVLVTSRRGLWSPDVAVVSRPLDYLSRAESKSLLQHLGVTLEDSLADEIAMETGDLPLAIYLAGRFLQRYQRIKPHQYLDQLRTHGVLAHPSLQGRGLTHSPTQHDLHVSRTFSLNFDQLDAEDEVDGLALRFIAGMVSLAHGEPIGRDLLQEALCRNQEDELMREILTADAFDRLINLGLVRVVGEDSVQVHRLLAAHIQLILAPLVSESRQALIGAWLTQIEAQFGRDAHLSTLAVPVTHLQALTREAIARKDEQAPLLARFLAHHWMDLAEHKKALAVLEAGIELQSDLVGRNDLLIAELYYLGGVIILRTRDPAGARPYFEDALAIRLSILGQNHVKTVVVLDKLGTIDNLLGDVASAKRYLGQVLEAYEQWEPPDEEGIGGVSYSLSILHYLQGELDTAFAYISRSREIREALLPSDSPYLASTLSIFGLLSMVKGDFLQALDVLHQAHTAMQQKLGDRNPFTLTLLSNRGTVECLMGRTEAAEKTLEAALARGREILPAQNPSLSFILTGIGRLSCRQGRYTEAESYLLEAKAIAETGHLRQSPLMETLLCLAETYIGQERFEEARAILSQFKATEKEAFPPTHFRIGYRLWVEGDLATAEGDRPLGQTLYKEAIQFLQQAGLGEHPDVVQLMALIK